MHLLFLIAMYVPYESSVSSVVCMRRSGKPDPLVSGIENIIESLEESKSVYEVHSTAAFGSDVAYDQIYLPRDSADRRVESAREDLCVCCKLVSYISDLEIETL